MIYPRFIFPSVIDHKSLNNMHIFKCRGSCSRPMGTVEYKPKQQFFMLKNVVPVRVKKGRLAHMMHLRLHLHQE